MAPMRLSPWEEDRLLIFTAAELARRHRAAGVALNHPEVVALICDAMLEAARVGATYQECAAAGRAAVRRSEVMDGVRELLDEIRVEVLLGDGTRLIVLVDPLGDGGPPAPDGPGAIVAAEGDPRPHMDRDTIALSVTSTSRRVVRVSSHYPFDRVNARLAFDREKARGRHLDIPAGASERWAPGETREVLLVRYAGTVKE